MFNERKATTLSLYFLEQANDSKLEYIKLMKLLYLTERKLLEKGKSIFIFDDFVAMKLGPVLSNVYNLIKQEDNEHAEGSLWNKHITTEKYDIRTNRNSESDERYVLINELPADVKSTADEIYKKFQGYQWGELVEYTHKRCEEWKDVFEGKNVGVADIPLDLILDKLGKSEEEKQEIYYNISICL